jgi:hypothetical protein
MSTIVLALAGAARALVTAQARAAVLNGVAVFMRSLLLMWDMLICIWISLRLVCRHRSL